MVLALTRERPRAEQFGSRGGNRDPDDAGLINYRIDISGFASVHAPG